jgi:hypothetical protein
VGAQAAAGQTLAWRLLVQQPAMQLPGLLLQASALCCAAGQALP